MNTMNPEWIHVVQERAQHMQDANLLDETAEAIIRALEPLIRAEQEKAVAEERDAARAEVEQLRELAKTNFDLFHEAKQEQRQAAADRDLARVEVAVLQDALEDVVNQACSESGTDLDSMALSGYAHGMRVLAERGRIIIEREVGRRVIGRWVNGEAHQ